MFLMVNVVIAAAIFSVQLIFGQSRGESVFIVPDFDIRIKDTTNIPDQPKAS